MPVAFENLCYSHRYNSFSKTIIFRLNAQILGALLHQACYNTDFPYVLKVMELCVIEEVKPNKKFMDELEKFRRKCKDMSNDKVSKILGCKIQSVQF